MLVTIVGRQATSVGTTLAENRRAGRCRSASTGRGQPGRRRLDHDVAQGLVI
jgi:hypothetical protein